MKKIGMLLAFFLAAAMPARAEPFAKGADIGWLQQMEATGYRFYNEEGKQDDALRILKDHGMTVVQAPKDIMDRIDEIGKEMVQEWLSTATAEEKAVYEAYRANSK